MSDQPDDRFEQLARRAIGRLTTRIESEAPELARHAVPWIGSLSAGSPESYFTHPEAFPMLQLPWWLEESLGGAPDAALQSELAYASVSGYYFVRMIDDLMDGDAAVPVPALPALILFHTEFVATYRGLFGADHPFWRAFTHFSYEAANTAAADAALETIDQARFMEFSARKIAGAKIALAAVCHRHGRTETLVRWSELTDTLGRWHQMRNDVLGWVRDKQHGRATYFLSEAERRVGPDGDIVGWVGRDGLGWSRQLLTGWMDELLETARDLRSAALVDYLEQRRRAATAGWNVMESSFDALNRLASSMPPGSSRESART